jgi:hypothetical protein
MEIKSDYERNHGYVTYMLLSLYGEITFHVKEFVPPPI